MATKRLEHLQRCLIKDAETKELYQEFLNEYNENHDPNKVQYLPHHCILRPSSTTTKLRIVFDASAKTTSGFSLNDIQHTVAKVQ